MLMPNRLARVEPCRRYVRPCISADRQSIRTDWRSSAKIRAANNGQHLGIGAEEEIDQQQRTRIEQVGLPDDSTRPQRVGREKVDETLEPPAVLVGWCSWLKRSYEKNTIITAPKSSATMSGILPYQCGPRLSGSSNPPPGCRPTARQPSSVLPSRRGEQSVWVSIIIPYPDLLMTRIVSYSSKIFNS